MNKSLGTFLQQFISDNANSEINYISDSIINTSLGSQLIKIDEHNFQIDLSFVKTFSGLNIFVDSIVVEVIEQCGFGSGDITVKHKIDPKLTTELMQLGINWVMLNARFDISDSFLWNHKKFTENLYTVFYTIQYAKWGSILFPDYFNPEANNSHNIALMFPFSIYDNSQDNFFILAEYNQTGKFLRLTIESGSESRLQLKHIKHRVVDSVARINIFNDINSFTHKIYYGILRETQNYKDEHSESYNDNTDIFSNLNKNGFYELNKITFHWNENIFQSFGENAKVYLNNKLKKILYLIEDTATLNIIQNGSIIRIIDNEFESQLILSRHGKCLKIALGKEISSNSLGFYLDKMPDLKKLSNESKDKLKDTRIFLIHHITAEVIGLIKALNDCGADSITTFFVKYGGIIPESYLDTILSLPEDVFKFYSLYKNDIAGNFTGLYSLSDQFGNYFLNEDLDLSIRNNHGNFLESMRHANFYLFLLELINCKINNKQLLIIEDGGYICPLINQFCLEDLTLEEVIRKFKYDINSNLYTELSKDILTIYNSSYNECVGKNADQIQTLSKSENSKADLKLTNDNFGLDIKFKSLIDCTLIGGVEHTRNGYDANLEIQNCFNKLYFPVCSIAISNFKKSAEAKECCYSIINAIENIMNMLGFIFQFRNILILGSKGAIGKIIFEYLIFRNGLGKVFGIDIAYTKDEKKSNMFNNIIELPQENLANIDLIIGVVGKSIITTDIFEEIIINGKNENLILASGSTKTVEFMDIENYLNELSIQPKPSIKGINVDLVSSPIRDLQSGMLLGTCIKLKLENQPVPQKSIYMFGNLTPVNFIYYGIAREMIDKIMSQLLSVSIGLVHNKKNLPEKLLAVDMEINLNAELIN